MNDKKQQNPLNPKNQALNFQVREMLDEELENVVGGFEIPKNDTQYEHNLYTPIDPNFEKKF